MYVCLVGVCKCLISDKTIDAIHICNMDKKNCEKVLINPPFVSVKRIVFRLVFKAIEECAVLAFIEIYQFEKVGKSNDCLLKQNTK